MNNEYQEEVVCGKCKTVHARNLEVIEVTGKHCELDQPLKVIVVKKFKCKKCKETENYTVNIVKNESVRDVI